MKKVVLMMFLLVICGLSALRSYAADRASLSWVPSTSTSAVGVNVYRATTSGGTYAKIGTISNVTAGFDDLTGTPNVKYFYIVRSYDSFGQESNNSNEASATFPLPASPLPPTNLVATPK